MNYKNLSFSVLTAAFVFLVACAQNSSNSSNSSSENKTNDSIASQPKDSASQAIEKLNDIAKFISGYEVSKSSELYELTQTPEWKAYETEAKTAWARFDSIAKKYSDFSKSEITAPYDTIKSLFYPFSGPDFLFANIMFPNVSKMVLIGLEGPGSVPLIDKSSKDSLKTILALYRVAIEDVTQLSFFRTIDMKNELGNKEIDGTAPIIMLFLCRAGKEIVSVTPMYLNKDGVPTPVANTKPLKQATVVEIVYHDKGSNVNKMVTYLSTNVADPSLSQNAPFLKYLKNMDNNCVSFVKSATYLMHKSYFGIIRNTTLNKSAFILQDDSGIGYKYFNKDKWNIQLYGTYTKPIKLFEEFFEQDYYDAFQNGHPKKLKFRIGYSPKSNLLIAKRK